MTAPSARTRQRTLILLFTVYLALLVWIVVFKLHVPYLGEAAMRDIKLVPFVRTATHGASAPREVFANLALFVPFGLYLGLVARSWPWWRAAGAIAGTSLLLEVAQYVLAVGKSDLTDVLVNTAGGMLGIGLLALARRSLRRRTAIVMTGILATGTVLALGMSGLLASAHLPLMPPRVDVRMLQIW